MAGRATGVLLRPTGLLGTQAKGPKVKKRLKLKTKLGVAGSLSSKPTGASKCSRAPLPA